MFTWLSRWSVPLIYSFHCSRAKRRMPLDALIKSFCNVRCLAVFSSENTFLPWCVQYRPAVHYCYLRIENAEGYVLIAVYLFIYLYGCYSQNAKSIKPKSMEFGGMIGYYPGTIWLDFGINRVKGHEKVKIFFFNFYPIGMQLMPTCS